MKKWLLACVGILLAMLLAYVAAGPYLAINGIRNVIASGDYGQLSYFVDFARLRTSVTPQIQSRIDRGLKQRLGSGTTGGIASGMALAISEPAIDAMVSPMGVATLLTGSSLARKLTGQTSPDGRVHAVDPLKDASTHYVSASRFTATVMTEESKRLVFVFERDGLQWKLTGLTLPD